MFVLRGWGGAGRRGVGVVVEMGNQLNLLLVHSAWEWAFFSFFFSFCSFSFFFPFCGRGGIQSIENNAIVANMISSMQSR